MLRQIKNTKNRPVENYNTQAKIAHINAIQPKN